MPPKILVFASGTKDGGGSGFQNLVEWSRANPNSFEVVGVVSSQVDGGVKKRAEALKVPFTYFPGPYEAAEYKKIAASSGAEWFALSGWLRMVKGLDPKRTFNIHPAPLSLLNGRFGGSGMWGQKVADAVHDALQKKEIQEFGASMHFVTDEYDRGPVFFEYRIPYREGVSKEDVAELVHTTEHEFQPKVTNLVVHGAISWDGKDPKSVKVPAGYQFLPGR
jgi:folate-dependent phosphoribosylglycinamide formyltransferase PurN